MSFLLHDFAMRLSFNYFTNLQTIPKVANIGSKTSSIIKVLKCFYSFWFWSASSVSLKFVSFIGNFFFILNATVCFYVLFKTFQQFVCVIQHCYLYSLHYQCLSESMIVSNILSRMLKILIPVVHYSYFHNTQIYFYRQAQWSSSLAWRMS